MGAVTAEYAYNELGYKTVYVITDDFIDYTKSLSKYFIVRFEELGGKVVFEDTYTQGQADVSAQLARIKALPEKPDFIYVSSYMPDLALMIRTLRESGVTQPVSAATRTTTRRCSRPSARSTAATSTSTRTATSPTRPTPSTARSRPPTRRSSARLPRPSGSCPATTSSWCSPRRWRRPARPMAPRLPRPWKTTTFDLFTGKLDWSDAASGHEPNKAAALVQLTEGKPKFLGWKIPEKLPTP